MLSATVFPSCGRVHLPGCHLLNTKVSALTSYDSLSTDISSNHIFTSMVGERRCQMPRVPGAGVRTVVVVGDVGLWDPRRGWQARRWVPMRLQRGSVAERQGPGAPRLWLWGDGGGRGPEWGQRPAGSSSAESARAKCGGRGSEPRAGER